jgi:hypothetical protein
MEENAGHRQAVSSDIDPLNLVDPYCFGLEEIPNSSEERARVSQILQSRRIISASHSPTHDRSSSSTFLDENDSPLFIHLAHGLAYTVGSALGSRPPSEEACLAAYIVANKAGLTAGSRAWSKHSHRSLPIPSDTAEEDTQKRSAGWWGTPSGPVSLINERSLRLFWKVMDNATWRNLHWLPHEVLVYEVRVPEGYGMRWSQDQADRLDDVKKENWPWLFRGFLEPSMENGHELKWRHPISLS